MGGLTASGAGAGASTKANSSCSSSSNALLQLLLEAAAAGFGGEGSAVTEVVVEAAEGRSAEAAELAPSVQFGFEALGNDAAARDRAAAEAGAPRRLVPLVAEKGFGLRVWCHSPRERF